MSCTIDQALAHLARAQIVRAERAAFKRALRDRDHAACLALDLLADPPVWAASWRVADFLACLPSWGPKIRVPVAMRRANIAALARIGTLTDRQRDALRTEIAAWNAGRAA